MLTFYVYVGSGAGKSPCEKAKTFFIFLPAPRNFFCQSSWRPPLPFVPACPKANAVSRVDNALLFAHGSRFMESSTYLAILRTSFLLLQTPRNVSLLVVVVVVEKNGSSQSFSKRSSPTEEKTDRTGDAEGNKWKVHTPVGCWLGWLVVHGCAFILLHPYRPRGRGMTICAHGRCA